ncbi:glycosyltransferase family 4 protein [Planctomycetaceae bacterium SH139]
MKSEPQIIFDSRWIGPHGIGRFASELRDRLPQLSHPTLGGNCTSPLDCLRLGVRFSDSQTAFFSPGFNPPLTLRFWPAAPFIFTLHDLIHVNYPAEASLAKRLYYQCVVRPAAKRAFKVLTVSEYSKREIISWTGIPSEQVEVVYNGVGSAFTPVGAKRQTSHKYLLYVGNQKPHKNVGGLLRAFALLRSEFDLRLAISGEATAETASQVDALGMQDHVEFLGKLSDEQLAAAYRGAEATVLASAYEGFGLPVVESMACGTPVVCSNVTSLPEIAGDAAQLVNIDAASIAAGIASLLHDQSLQATLIARGLRRAANFTWEATATRVATVLDQLKLHLAADSPTRAQRTNQPTEATVK